MITGRIAGGLAGILALAAMALPGSDQAAHATTFNPQFSSPVSFSDTTPGGNPNITIGFDIPPPSALGGAVNFSDPALTTATDTQIPTGAYIGQINTIAKLGLANEGCVTDTPVEFDLVEANTQTAALAMTPNVTLTAAITAEASSFTYTSTGDPIGPSDSNPVIIKAEIEIDSEQMLVTNIVEGTNTYSSVTRGWNGTTPSTHAAGAQIRKVNVIFPAGPSSNQQGNLVEDDGDLDNNGTAEFPQFTNNGIADTTDSMPASVRDSLDPNGNPDDGGAVTQQARYFGASVVANTLIIPINIVFLSPGGLSAFPNNDWMVPSWGTPSVIILGDPEAPPTNSGISDFCNLSSVSTIFGVSHDNACTTAVAPPPECTSVFAGFNMRGAVDGGCPGTTTPNECGFARATNPAVTTTLKARAFAASERDYDNDGHPNALDVCALTPNPAWDPRDFNVLSGGDADGDGLPDACDPGPSTFNNDQDGDAWQNRIDNCPNIANAVGGGPGPTPNTGQWDQDVPRGQSVGDSGSHADAIGPACDIAANNCAGCPALTPTAPNGHYHATAIVSHVCIGPAGADSDNDGVCNLDEPAAQNCAGGINDADCDDDLVGDRLDNCIAGSNPRPTNFAQSQRDINADGFSDITDVSALTSAFGAEGGNPSNDGVGDGGVPGYHGRLDLNYDSFIDISDVSLITAVFGSAC